MYLAFAAAALLLASDASAQDTSAPAASARPPQSPDLPACRAYGRQSPDAPPIVRTWLARSRDDHVLVCATAQQPGAGAADPLYSGESAPAKHGEVCSYTTQFLTRTGAGAVSRLQRSEAPEGLGMAVVGSGGCPPPHEAATVRRYTLTYDLTPTIFESLMAFWGAAAISVSIFDRDLACCGGGPQETATAGGVAANAQRLRLRAAIVAGRMQSAAVTRIVRVPARGLNRRYALFIDDPERRAPAASVYVVYVSRFFRGSWHISGISDVAP